MIYAFDTNIDNEKILSYDMAFVPLVQLQDIQRKFM